MAKLLSAIEAGAARAGANTFIQATEDMIRAARKQAASAVETARENARSANESAQASVRASAKAAQAAAESARILVKASRDAAKEAKDSGSVQLAVAAQVAEAKAVSAAGVAASTQLTAKAWIEEARVVAESGAVEVRTALKTASAVAESAEIQILNTRRVTEAQALGMKSASGLSSSLLLLASGAGAIGVVKTIASYEGLKSALITATKSSEGAEAAFKDLQKFADKTPYTLEQATKAYIRMSSAGLKPSIEALTDFGDIASAIPGKSILDFVEAVADGTQGQGRRLKEFGIDLNVQGQNVELVFGDMHKVVLNNAKAIEEGIREISKVNFGGSMARQAATLAGQWSTLQDKAAGLAAEVGQGGLLSALKDVVVSLTDTASGSQSAARELGAGLGNIVRVVGGGAAFLAEHLDAVKTVLIGIMTLKTFTYFATMLTAIEAEIVAAGGLAAAWARVGVAKTGATGGVGALAGGTIAAGVAVGYAGAKYANEHGYFRAAAKKLESWGLAHDEDAEFMAKRAEEARRADEVISHITQKERDDFKEWALSGVNAALAFSDSLRDQTVVAEELRQAHIKLIAEQNKEKRENPGFKAGAHSLTENLGKGLPLLTLEGVPLTKPTTGDGGASKQHTADLKAEAEASRALADAERDRAKAAAVWLARFEGHRKLEQDVADAVALNDAMKISTEEYNHQAFILPRLAQAKKEGLDPGFALKEAEALYKVTQETEALRKAREEGNKAEEKTSQQIAKEAKQKSPFQAYISQMTDLKELTLEWQNMAISGINKFSDTLTNALFGDKVSWKDFFRQTEKDIVKMIIQMTIAAGLKAIISGGTAGGISLGAGILGNLFVGGSFHDGGVAGSGGASRAMSSSWFAGAPRYHGGGIAGLRPDEVPAILQTGERVLSRAQTNAQGGGKPQKIVNLHLYLPGVTDPRGFGRSAGQQAGYLRRLLGEDD